MQKHCIWLFANLEWQGGFINADMDFCYDWALDLGVGNRMTMTVVIVEQLRPGTNNHMLTLSFSSMFFC